MNSRLLMANVVLTGALALSLAGSVIGPVATKVGTEGTWFFLWAPVFWLIRAMSFFIFPLIALILGYLTMRRPAKSNAAIVHVAGNIVFCVVLAVSVVGIQGWARSQGSEQRNRDPVALTSLMAHQGTNSGFALPQLALRTLEGKDVTVQDLTQGSKLSVIFFWASYDHAWSRNVTLASSSFRDYGTNGLAVVGIDEGGITRYRSNVYSARKGGIPSGSR